ncbi:MAG: hypothetical protein WCF65_04795 [Parachlamydiaceae bacterium]
MLFLKYDKPLLEKAGWHVEIDTVFPIHRLIDSDDIYIDVDQTENATNWFDDWYVKNYFMFFIFTSCNTPLQITEHLQKKNNRTNCVFILKYV